VTGRCSWCWRSRCLCSRPSTRSSPPGRRRWTPGRHSRWRARSVQPRARQAAGCWWQLLPALPGAVAGEPGPLIGHGHPAFPGCRACRRPAPIIGRASDGRPFPGWRRGVGWWD